MAEDHLSYGMACQREVISADQSVVKDTHCVQAKMWAIWVESFSYNAAMKPTGCSPVLPNQFLEANWVSLLES
jgi:hypothetical protein